MQRTWVNFFWIGCSEQVLESSDDDWKLMRIQKTSGLIWHREWTWKNRRNEYGKQLFM
jgi:hypothetical protein